MAAKRVSVQFSRAYWQTNEFRSSRNAPCALRGPFLRGHAALKRALATYTVVLATDFPDSSNRAALSFGNHYSETRFAANGGLGTTPKLDLLPARPQRDGEKIPDGPSRAGFLTPTREGPQRGTTCSLSSPRGRPEALRAGGCPGPGPCGIRRCRCGP